MLSRRSLWIVCAVAVAHGLFFIWYQSPDWNTAWPDQDGYRRLGQVLATTGKFTRFPDAPPFVPEVIRTPAYPVFVAAIYKVAGVGQMPVALIQTGAVLGICLLVFAIARRIVASERVALGAALVTALFPPIPYFGALVMTEVWTTLLFTVALWLTIRALDDGRATDFALLGVTLGLTALSRPAFVLFPFALAAVGLIVAPRIGRHAPARHWATMLAVFAITMLPWFAYNYVTLGAFTLSPAGGVGRGIWEGSWQATWSGRLQNELTHLADDIDDRRELDQRIRAVAAREQLSPEPMLDYVHQWEDIRRIWTEPADSARARPRARAGRPGIPARRPRQHPRRTRRRARAPSGARRLHPVGRRDSRSATATSTGCRRWSFALLGDSGGGRRPRRRRPRGARAERTRGRRRVSRGAYRIHHGGAFPAADRSAAVAAGAADSCCCSPRSAAGLTRHSFALEPQVHEREHL